MTSSKITEKSAETSSGTKLRLLIAWAWVGIPLAWGVSQTFIKAMGLFK